ncbi:hypothetical protein ACQEU8_19865 [Streptomyces sp. CA-250714]|uniref:hypothetical protein n=1 Tax=Streptomyces sp. CA-250714 TaxID=3240060 RepID=UPI003D8B0444
MGIRDRVRGIGDSVSNVAASAAMRGRELTDRGAEARRNGAVNSGEWVLKAVRALPAPAAPAEEPWEFSLGALVSQHPKVPALTAKALRPLRSLGALSFGPESVGFDGEDIPWKKVVSLRLHNAFAAMSTEGLDHEVDRIRDVLPPLPGRKWAVTKVVEGLGSVVLASLERASGQRLDTVDVASEITYRGLLGRETTLRASLFPTALLAHQVEVADSLVVTAQQWNIPVLPAEPVDVDTVARIRALRARADKVYDELLAEDDREPQQLDQGEEPQEASAQRADA